MPNRWQLSIIAGQQRGPCSGTPHASKWGIEGFAESVAQKVAPFGIGVTIVEPGGARTEFRYGSAQVADLNPAYDGNPAHAFLAMLDQANGLAVGDPARMAARIIDSVDTEPAPLRIVLGSQALDSTVATLQKRIAGFGAQRELAASTDFRPESDAMAISDTARRNHEELFPGHVSTLKVTDPELIEYFDNFAFDEVLRHGGLNTRTRLMVQLASMIACQAVSEYRVMLGAALTVGVTPIEVKEIVYQAVPYVGMAKVFDFLHATNDVLTARGVELPLDGQSTTTVETREEKGLAVQKQIVGADTVDAMYAAAAQDEIHFQHFLSANCFGDHYTRTGIDEPTRELLTFAMLISLGGCEPQAEGHVAANLNVGNSRDVLLAVITQRLPFIGYPRSLNALRVLNKVTSR